MLRRKRWLLVAGFVFSALAVGAWFGMRKPKESIFVSFPESDRWSYTATHTVFSGTGLAEYGVYSGLRTREPWATARPRIERDLTAAGFRRMGGGRTLIFWRRSDADVFVNPAGAMPGKPADLTTASITRRATIPEAGRSWIRDRLTITSPGHKRP